MRSMMIAVILFFCVEESIAQTPISFGGRRLGTLEDLKIAGDENDKNRLMISALASLDSLPRMLDEEISSWGSFLGGCSKRLYWRGGTTIRHGGRELGLKSRIRYKHRICAIFKSDWVSISTDVEWKLSVQSGSPNDLRLIAKVTNVKNVPPAIEKFFGLRVSDDIKIPIPARCGKCDCAAVLENLGAKLEDVRFDQKKGLRVIVKWSVRGDNLPTLLNCF